MTQKRDSNEFPTLAERITASPEAASNLGLATLLFSASCVTLTLIQLNNDPSEALSLLILITAGLSATGWYLLASVDYLLGHRTAFRLWMVFSIVYICTAGLALSFIADAARAT